MRKWGKSLALRIPKSLAVEAGLEENAPVDLSLIEGKLTVARAPEPAFTLDALLREVTDENLHVEVDTGRAIGNETW